jgi:hypothetical protein
VLEFEYTGLPSLAIFGPGAARGPRLVDVPVAEVSAR